MVFSASAVALRNDADISLRSAAKEIWNDNGTNFLGGEKELRRAKKEWNQRAIIESTHEKGVEWRFQPFKTWHLQPPTASHMSGVWEHPHAL
jgi:hypothetical protein